MTAKTAALVRRLKKRQMAVHRHAIGILKTLSSEDRLAAMVKAGILTKKGMLTASYRPRSTTAAAR